MGFYIHCPKCGEETLDDGTLSCKNKDCGWYQGKNEEEQIASLRAQLAAAEEREREHNCFNDDAVAERLTSAEQRANDFAKQLAALRAQLDAAEERARKSEEALNEVRAVLKGPTSMGDMLDAVQLRVMSAEDLAASRADAVREFAEWREIATVPRDGTAVLVMSDDWPGTKTGKAMECNGHNTYVAEWWQEDESDCGEWVCYMDSIDDPRCPITPTHWMPLPRAPHEDAARYLSSLGVPSARPDDGRVERVLRRGLEEMAELDCAYGDRCPTFSRHGRCTGCKARAVLAAADGEVEP
jgi:hypothetical protein